MEFNPILLINVVISRFSVSLRVLLTGLWVLHSRAPNEWTGDELKRIWKEAVLA
jgi:hypothetical protein